MSAGRHPAARQLALLAGGDLSPWTRFMLRRHVGRCPECGAELAALAGLRQDIRTSAMRMPDGVDWANLSAEMKANIHLGLQMSEIARTVPSSAQAGLDDLSLPRVWRTLAVAASLALVIFSGWFLSSPRDFYHRLDPPVAQATGEGVGVAERGATMTLLAPGVGLVSTSAQVGAGVERRYVDADSGQVTIHHVFAE